MPRFYSLALLLLACAASAQRVETDPGDAPADQSASARSARALADARLNFATVVESWLTKQGGEDGVWTARHPDASKPWKLRLKSVDEASVEPVVDGAGTYKGRALMSVNGTHAVVPVNFTVDMSGSDWRVVKAEWPESTRTPAKADKGKADKGKPGKGKPGKGKAAKKKGGG